MKDQKLFEEEQQIYEAIEIERLIVSVEIQDVVKTIERKEKEKQALEERLGRLTSAAKLAEPKNNKEKT